MKITIESTTQLVSIEVALPGNFEARVWEGHTETGIPVSCLIARISVAKDQDQSQFEKELQECRPPRVNDVFPLRMVL